MRYAKALVLAIIVIVAAAIGGVIAQTQKNPPNPVPPVASAQFCGNIVVITAAKTALFEQMQAEGCAVTHFVDLGEDYWLAYGVKITREMQ